MSRLFLIGHNDLKLFLRGKAGWAWLFLVPFFFIYFMGLAFKGAGAPGNPRLNLLVENQDRGFLGALLLDELRGRGLNFVGPQNSQEAERGLRIPPDFTEKVLRQEPARVAFFQLAGAGGEAGVLIQARLLRALIALNSDLFELATAGSNAVIDEAAVRQLMRRADPVAVQASFAGRRPIPAGFSQSLPGNLVMFLMMNLLIFGGASIASERTEGLLKRLAIYPLAKWELVTGKIYGRFLLGIVQVVFFLILGRFLFQIAFGSNLGWILITLSIYCWLAAALGVCIGAAVKNPDQTVGLCVLSSMLMAALGGCWWPLEIVPETMQAVGRLFPTAWAMDALHQLISFGGGFATIAPKLATLAFFAIAATFAAARILRY